MRVTLADVGHRFAGAPWLFRHVSVTLHDEQVYGLVGPSGSGKSTLLAIVGGLIAPAEGTTDRSEVNRTTWIAQNPHGVAGRTARDHVMLPLLAAGAAVAEATTVADDLLGRFGLGQRGDARYAALSGGEAQRLMFARGVATRPQLLLVDEPTAQLDRRRAAAVDDVIRELAGSGTVVIVATHDERTKDACTTVLDLGDFGLDDDGATDSNARAVV